MIALFARFGVAIHVALLVIWSSWARGGSSPAYLWALPWLSLGVIEMLFLLPPRQRDESPRSAVRHLVRRIVSDPVFYFGALLLVFLAFQWLNGPVELEWDDVDNVWRFGEPPLPGLPFCADQDGARQVFIWFMAVVTAVLAIRNGTGPRSRYLILRILVVNGALLAILGFLQAVTCPNKLFWYRPMSVFFFSTFGYPNHAGAFFVLTSAVNMGLLIRALGAMDDANHPIFYGITLILNGAGAYASLCRAAIVLGTLLVLFAILYGTFFLFGKISRATGIKILGAFAAMACCGAIFLARPGTGFAKEVATLSSESAKTVYGGDRAQLLDAALEIWKDNPWPGVGGWGFRQYVGLYVGEENWKMLQQNGKANVHNDLAQMLCEHGAIGGGLILAIVVALLVHLAIRLATMRRMVNPANDKDESWLRSIPPTVVMSLAGCTCTVVHCTIDLPFRSTAILLTWFIVLACLPGFVHRHG